MGSCLTVYLLEAGGVGMFRPCARTSGIAIAIPKPQDLTLFGWVFGSDHWSITQAWNRALASENDLQMLSVKIRIKRRPKTSSHLFTLSYKIPAARDKTNNSTSFGSHECQSIACFYL